ncbi:MAG: helix-turn-helix transcriptional regulator [Roseovarius sp.]
MAHSPTISTIAAWADGRNWTLELQHSRACHALIWLTRGQTRAVIEGQRRGIGVHNVLVIPAHTMFALQMSKQSFGMVCQIPAGERLMMPDTPVLLSIQDVRNQAELTSLMDAMQREQTSDLAFADEAIFAHGELLTVWLRRAMIRHPAKPTRETATQRLVRAFSALVERDYRSGRVMADYASTLGVTPTHLSRVCKQTSGLTAADILTERVLHAARTALEDTAQPITQIAATLGFNSGAYFSRFVQHHTGATPSALRKAVGSADI